MFLKIKFNLPQAGLHMYDNVEIIWDGVSHTLINGAALRQPLMMKCYLGRKEIFVIEAWRGQPGNDDRRPFVMTVEILEGVIYNPQQTPWITIHRI